GRSAPPGLPHPPDLLLLPRRYNLLTAPFAPPAPPVPPVPEAGEGVAGSTNEADVGASEEAPGAATDCKFRSPPFAKPFQCPVDNCYRSYKSSSSLRSHARNCHPQEKLYNLSRTRYWCSVCDWY